MRATAGDGDNPFIGTGTLVSVPSVAFPDRRYRYLVTAKHVTTQLGQGDDIFVRANTTNGRSRRLKVKGTWFRHDDPSVDLAVLPVHLDESYDVKSIPISNFNTAELAQQHEIGIGDDVVTVGLFSMRGGDERNLPILRSGIISTMPDEPIKDTQNGLDFEAYIIELRSLGGLSGAPVFVSLDPYSPGRGSGRMLLLGIMRGGFKDRVVLESLGPTSNGFFLGLSTVTPIERLAEILMRADVAVLRGDHARR
jgi:hypothetical protein